MMGYPFVCYDGMTERLKYKYVEISVRDTFDKEFTMRQRFRVTGQSEDNLAELPTPVEANEGRSNGAASSAASEPTTPAIKRAATTPRMSGDKRLRNDSRPDDDTLNYAEDPAQRREKAKTRAKALIAAKNKQEKKKGKKPPPVSSTFKAMCSKMQLLSTSASSLLATIDGEQTWAWARTSEMRGELHNRMEELQAEVPSLVSKCIAEGFEAVDKYVTEEGLDLDNELSTANDDIEWKLVDLSTFIDNLKNMHKNRPSW